MKQNKLKTWQVWPYEYENDLGKIVAANLV